MNLPEPSAAIASDRLASRRLIPNELTVSSVEFENARDGVHRQRNGSLAVRPGDVELGRNYGKSENYKLWGGASGGMGSG